MLLILIGALDIWLGLFVFKNPKRMESRMPENYEMSDSTMIKVRFGGVFAICLGVILLLVGLSSFI
jgi:hypothetical protein